MPAPQTPGPSPRNGRLPVALRALVRRLSPPDRPPRPISPRRREVAATGGLALGCLPIWLLGLVAATLATDACPCSTFYEWLTLLALTACCVAAIATARLWARGRRAGRVRWRRVAAGVLATVALAMVYLVGLESIPIR